MGMRNLGRPGEPPAVTIELLRVALMNWPRADPDDCV